METALLSDTSESTCQRQTVQSQSQQPHHHHIPKVFALPDTTPEKQETSRLQEQQQQQCEQVSTTMIQLVRQGEGRERMSLPNFVSKKDDNYNEKELSLHRPILVRDTPESIGMKIPKGDGSNSRTGDWKSPKKKKQSRAIGSPKSRKRKTPTTASNTNANANGSSSSSSNGTHSVPFSVRDVADVVGHSSPVQVINILNQEVEEDLADWTFHDLVEYFEDTQRIARNNSMHHRQPSGQAPTEETQQPPIPIPVTTAISPTTGRSRRKAAIRSEECFNTIIHDEGSSGVASTRILNQISYEFSGTPLHTMVQSPQVVRDIDWIDHAWPAERKPERNRSEYNQGSNQNSAHNKISNNNKSNIKTSKKVSKGKNSIEYPAVQYYCLTSSAGSYTDFHIDFGGSSVWYHVVRGQKIFVVSPPTRQNLRVYEEWLCHPNQEKLFLPDLMKESACPDIHRYSTGDAFSSTASYSSASTAATYASSSVLGDLADEMAFFQNSLKNALSTSNALRFTLNAGETLVLPAGWIHAVYTPVDSLVFGGNFLHGLDMQMQLTVNGIEARSKVLDQYRFPHFGALQMYAGGMYLQRLRATRKEAKPNSANGDCEIGADPANVRVEEKQEGQEQEENSTKRKQVDSYSITSVSPRELEELPMLMNALEYWWLSEQDSEENPDTIKTKETKKDASVSRTLDSVTCHSSFRNAALYVANESGHESVEDFIAAFRNEYARVSNEQWGSCRVAPSDDPNGHFGPLSLLPVPLSSIPIAIGKPKKSSTAKRATHKNKKDKPRHKRIRKGTTDLDDPMDVVLSKKVKEYLTTIQITTAAQLLLARTTDVAKGLQEWRKQNGMSELKGRAGAVASVSVWKRKVRLRAVLVGAKQLAQLNEGTNMKPLRPNDKQDRKPPPPNDNTK